MRSLIYVYLFLNFVLVGGCSPAGNSGDFPTPTSPMNPLPDHQKTGSREIAQGYINGHDWVFRSGRAYFKKYRPNYLIVQLWNEEIADPCKEKKGSSLQVHLTAPKELATWKISPGTPFNSNLSIFFTDFDFKPKLRDNMVADQGEIAFTAIEKDSVSGYVMGVFQSPKARAKDSRVVGDFVVPFCQ